MKGEQLITDYLRARTTATMLELCQNLSGLLGKWPYNVHLELANAISGHLDRGVAARRLEVDRSIIPFRYRISGE